MLIPLHCGIQVVLHKGTIYKVIQNHSTHTLYIYIFTHIQEGWIQKVILGGGGNWFPPGNFVLSHKNNLLSAYTY